MQLPELLSIEEIQVRLEAIFPEGTKHRTYVTREMAARTVYVMLYCGAIEGRGVHIGPLHVYRMTDEQAAVVSEEARLTYASRRRDVNPAGTRWYADNTREPIRDETLREGLVRLGAVVQKQDVATTASHGRYALRNDFAALFRPTLNEDALLDAIEEWRVRHLSGVALARIELLRQGTIRSKEKVDVIMPDGSIRQMASGVSSVISKAVIEEFAPRFLREPAVLLLSESGNKLVAQQETVMDSIGLHIDAAVLLPDIILFDMAEDRGLLVFVEVVANEGPITDHRKAALLEMTASSHIAADRTVFMTAYRDRSEGVFRRTFPAVAWDSMVWFMSEPDNIVSLETLKAE
ncbi:MAG TPA: BsuBI/PstI family type II restriction endonuclease [Thermoanaerobaculia bacterium]|jgi:hypothetical protein